jgi:hypothetical protein
MRHITLLVTLLLLGGQLLACGKDLQPPAASPAGGLAAAPALDQSLRPNAEAEQLALEATGAWLAPQSVYDRVVSELATIRRTYPATAGISARPSWAPDDLLLAFDEDGVTAITEGRYRAWDVLNRRYGVSQIDTHRLEKRGAVALTFAGRYNMPLLAEEYARLPNIRYAEPNYMMGDGDDVCLLIDRTKHFYVFDAGSGDCPAGCINHTYWGFASDVKGQITVLGTWERRLGDTEPGWLQALSACRRWL